jgi:carbon storage regulator
MLVLSRRVGEEIVIADNIRLTVVMVSGQTIRLGITAPSTIPVVRGELLAARSEGAPVTTVEAPAKRPGPGADQTEATS